MYTFHASPPTIFTFILPGQCLIPYLVKMESSPSTSSLTTDNLIPKSLQQIPEKGIKRFKLLEFLVLFVLLFIVVIYLRATGNAPILKQNKFKVASGQQFLTIQEFVRKQLMLQERDPLVIKGL